MMMAQGYQLYIQGSGIGDTLSLPVCSVLSRGFLPNTDEEKRKLEVGAARCLYDESRIST